MLSVKRLLFFHCAIFCCPSKPSFADLQEVPGASVQLAGERIYCQQHRDRKRWVINWQVIGSLLMVGGFVRVMERVKFNFVALSPGYCMIDLDSSARGYREGKDQQIYQIWY